MDVDLSTNDCYKNELDSYQRPGVLIQKFKNRNKKYSNNNVIWYRFLKEVCKERENKNDLSIYL